MLRDRICERCGKTFTPVRSVQRFCGSKTRKEGCSWAMQKEHARNYEHRNRLRMYAERPKKIAFTHCRCYLCPVHGNLKK